MTSIAYKVVWNANGVRVSCCQSLYFPDEFIATYAVDVKTIPPIENSKLFVFENLEIAIEWVRNTFILRKSSESSKMEVWECECDGLTLINRIPNPIRRWIINFWKEGIINKYESQVIYWAYMTDHVTLKERKYVHAKTIEQEIE